MVEGSLSFSIFTLGLRRRVSYSLAQSDRLEAPLEGRRCGMVRQSTDWLPLVFTAVLAFGGGWWMKTESMSKDVAFVDHLRLCTRTSPTTGRPMDICNTLDERLMEAIARPASECRKAFPKLDPRMEMACKDPDAEGWRL